MAAPRRRPTRGGVRAGRPVRGRPWSCRPARRRGAARPTVRHGAPERRPAQPPARRGRRPRATVAPRAPRRGPAGTYRCRLRRGSGPTRHGRVGRGPPPPAARPRPPPGRRATGSRVWSRRTYESVRSIRLRPPRGGSARGWAPTSRPGGTRSSARPRRLAWPRRCSGARNASGHDAHAGRSRAWRSPGDRVTLSAAEPRLARGVRPVSRSAEVTCGVAGVG